MDTLDADAHGQRIAIAWIAMEELRDLLNLRARVTGTVPDERAGRDRLRQFLQLVRAELRHSRTGQPRQDD